MADKNRFEIGQERAQVNFLTACAISKGYERFGLILGCKHPEVIIGLFGEQYSSYFSVAGLKKLSKCIENKALGSPGNHCRRLKKQFSRDHAEARKSVAYGSGAGQKLEGAVRALSILVPYIAALRYYEAAALPRLRHSLSGRNVAISERELAVVVSTHNYASLLSREKTALLEIALKYNKNTEDAGCVKLLEKHAKKFSAYALHGSADGKLSYDHFSRRLHELIVKPKTEIKREYIELKNAPLSVRTEKKRIFGKYGFSKQERELVKTLELASEIKVRITDSVFTVSAVSDAVDVLSKRWGMEKKYVYRMRPEEAVLYADSANMPQKMIGAVKNREKAAIWIKNNKIRFLYGSRAENLINKKTGAGERKIDIISGTPIFEGKVRGRVKVVRSAKDFFKVELGDILVCGDFSPDFVVLADKISAIIANEGGVMSHAAIIAREMKIPCVAGTKIATKALKDNDIVEIDSFFGTVKIIGRSHAVPGVDSL